jgi:hypothetical protein
MGWLGYERCFRTAARHFSNSEQPVRTAKVVNNDSPSHDVLAVMTKARVVAARMQFKVRCFKSTPP